MPTSCMQRNDAALHDVLHSQKLSVARHAIDKHARLTSVPVIGKGIRRPRPRCTVYMPYDAPRHGPSTHMLDMLADIANTPPEQWRVVSDADKGLPLRVETDGRMLVDGQYRGRIALVGGRKLPVALDARVLWVRGSVVGIEWGSIWTGGTRVHCEPNVTAIPNPPRNERWLAHAP